jgi:hypothetical protein
MYELEVVFLERFDVLGALCVYLNGRCDPCTNAINRSNINPTYYLVTHSHFSYVQSQGIYITLKQYPLHRSLHGEVHLTGSYRCPRSALGCQGHLSRRQVARVDLSASHRDAPSWLHKCC